MSNDPCEKFQANFFNKSKCQNCFKSRELHLPAHPRTEHAKALYAGWLCLAPEGAVFDKTPHRSRQKWQRRFFVLYEDGVVTFALDELPSTLPQGTLDMNACTAVLDAEVRTGQKNALCIVTARRQVFVRADNKDTISGWRDQLAAFMQANGNNVKKKRKVDIICVQAPSPAKMAAPGPTFQALVLADGQHQEDQQVEKIPFWNVTGGHALTTGEVQVQSLHPCGDLTEPESKSIQTCANNLSCDFAAGKLSMSGEASEPEQEVRMYSSRCGRSDARTSEREPDLLNFKKGWLVKLDDDAQWRKYWFVLSADCLKFYKDAAAEEASEQEGEVDLSECFKVTEQQIHKNYGLQIHTPKSIFTLSAMTAGIRRNWIQALMKNVHTAPDVTGLSSSVVVLSPNPESLVKPDVAPDWSESDRRSKPRSVLERRREGRYKTFDWTDFRPPGRSMDVDRSPAPPPPLYGELEKKKRREARRRRYESILGLPPGREVMGDAAAAAASLKDEMEACWKQVEMKNSLRNAKILHINDDDNNNADASPDYKKAFEDLKCQLELSERSRLELEACLSMWTFYHARATSECVHTSGDDVHSLGESPAVGTPGSGIPEHRRLVDDTPATWPDEKDEHLVPVWCESLAFTMSDSSDLQTDPESPNEALDMDFTCDQGELPSTDGPPFPDSEGDCRCIAMNGVAEAGGDQPEARKLFQEVEILSGQKEALNQRNQEMLNQLSEADREIQRLKEELSLRCPKKTEDLERELLEKDQRLMEAQARITSLEDRLGDADILLQQREEDQEAGVANDGVAGVGKAEGFLLRCFQATEARLTELERNLRQSELSCRRLQTENRALKEARNLHGQNKADFPRPAPADTRRQQMLKWSLLRWKVLDRFLDVVDRLEAQKEAGHPSASCQLKLEELCSELMDGVNANASHSQEQDEELLSDVAPQKILENQILTLGRNLLREDDSPAGLDGKLKENIQQVLGNAQRSNASESNGTSVDGEQPDVLDNSGVEFLGMIVQIFSSWINVVSSDTQDKVGMTAEHLRATFLFSTEAAFCCHMTSKCDRLLEENAQLQRRLSHTEKRVASVDAGCQTQQEAQEEQGEEGGQEMARQQEVGRVAALVDRVSHLEEELSVTRQKLSSDRRRHDEEMRNLKAECERGLATMEACHVKVAEELQQRHLQKVDCLLAERDRMLNEEAVATATAIEAIERAHSVELDKEVQRRYQTLNVTGNALMEEVYKLHSEELASCQRELEDLSYGFTLKCVEIGQMTQELDELRKTLSQQQQEKQDLMDQNQELSTHLAAEVSRLIERDVLPVNQDEHIYKMELLLRVKESELQSMRRQVAVLQDNLLAGHQIRVNWSDE
ncbi:myosin phosphatase Rho-interacting protein-like isoform X3 [Syngnathus scovelli]|uniref:myosin phosphatase Rho-interacting protein-like isoform X3 n=1 Tax=Syngnathus scovelli TaxID=161590 RepID=UPI00210FB442|nr:myosin phosphatase Rho-interacting protein-like isoform X1 [Syngnathus scovelli]